MIGDFDMNENEKKLVAAAVSLSGMTIGIFLLRKLFLRKTENSCNNVDYLKTVSYEKTVYAFSYSIWADNKYKNYTCLSYNKDLLNSFLFSYHRYDNPSYIRSMENEYVLEIAEKYDLNRIVILKQTRTGWIYDSIQ